MKLSSLVRWTTATALGAATLAVLPVTTASANPAGTGLVIREVYLNGGSTGSSFTNKFIELYNPTAAEIDVDGWSVQYKSSAGTTITAGNIAALGDHHVEAGGTLLVQAASNGTTTTALPTPDVIGSLNPSGSAGGVIAVSKSTTALAAATPAAMLADANLVDLLGYGTGNTFEGVAEPAGAYNVTTSLTRTATGVDSDHNANDFSPLTPPTPVACGTDCDGDIDAGPVDPPAEPEVLTIAQIQGPGAASPHVDERVTTRGVVTAVYPTGGFSGAYVQTAGTGGGDVAGRAASDGLFVFGSALAADVQPGDHVEVTGSITEFFGLTELVASADDYTVLAEPAVAIKPTEVQFPLEESVEGEPGGHARGASGHLHDHQQLHDQPVRRHRTRRW